MKKTLWLWTGLLMILSLVTACGGPSKQFETPAPSRAPVSAPVSEPVMDKAITKLLDKAKGIDEVYYEFSMKSDMLDMEGKAWTKGRKVRSEATVWGQKMITLLDFENGEAYTYMPDQQFAMKMDQKMLEAQDGQKPTDYTQSLDPGRTKVLESTTLNGNQCLLISSADPEGNPMKIWIAEEHGIPLRVEIEVYGSAVVVEFKNIKIGPISDDMFELPAGVTIQKINNAG